MKWLGLLLCLTGCAMSKGSSYLTYHDGYYSAAVQFRAAENKALANEYFHRIAFDTCHSNNYWFQIANTSATTITGFFKCQN